MEMTTKEAAERLGVSMRWVQALIKSERLPARKMGRDYLIDERGLRRVSDLKPGPKPSGKKRARR